MFKNISTISCLFVCLFVCLYLFLINTCNSLFLAVISWIYITALSFSRWCEAGAGYFHNPWSELWSCGDLYQRRVGDRVWWLLGTDWVGCGLSTAWVSTSFIFWTGWQKWVSGYFGNDVYVLMWVTDIYIKWCSEVYMYADILPLLLWA